MERRDPPRRSRLDPGSQHFDPRRRVAGKSQILLPSSSRRSPVRSLRRSEASEAARRAREQHESSARCIDLPVWVKLGGFYIKVTGGRADRGGLCVERVRAGTVSRSVSVDPVRAPGGSGPYVFPRDLCAVALRNSMLRFTIQLSCEIIFE